MDPLAQLFANLDHWRHLPAYQLERRADAFFSVYLADVVERATGVVVDRRIVPEFPLRKGTLDPTLEDDPKQRNGSNKVDYLVLAASGAEAFLIELKTDNASRNTEQNEYLAAAKAVGLPALIDGICKLVGRTGERRKYLHLLHLLAELSLIEVPAATAQREKQLLLAKAVKRTIPLSIIYIQPETTTEDDARVITFDDFARHVETRADPLSMVFAEHLRRWATTAAGARTLGA